MTNRHPVHRTEPGPARNTARFPGPGTAHRCPDRVSLSAARWGLVFLCWSWVRPPSHALSAGCFVGA